MVKELQDSYRNMQDDMISISMMKNKTKNRQEDFDDQRGMKKHIVEVLSYYMIKEDFDRWIKQNGIIR